MLCTPFGLLLTWNGVLRREAVWASNETHRVPWITDKLPLLVD
jgi:hypothetical protein